MSSELVPEPRRRERKKQRTRQALTDAAVKLFLKKGFDDVTVAEISDQVDVDPSTFFRYFGSKEAVLRSDLEDIVNNLGTILASRPENEPLRKSLLFLTKANYEKIQLDADLQRVRLKLAQGSSTVKTLTGTIEREIATELAKAIALRMGVLQEEDARPAIIAAAYSAAINWADLHQMEHGEAEADEVFSWVEGGLVDSAFFFSKSGKKR